MVATQAGVELESCEYRPVTDTYRVQYDREETPPSLAVVATLTKVMDRSPTQLEPLHSAVDADALDELLEVRKTMDGDLSVTFTVEGHSLTIDSSGTITVVPGSSTRTAECSD